MKRKAVERVIPGGHPVKIRDKRTRGWLWLQNQIVDHWLPKIGPAGLAMYIVLARYADQHDQSCYPSHATIAARMGMSRRSVIRTMKLLENVGLVEVERRHKENGAQTSNIYYLLDPPDPSDQKAQAPVPESHTPCATRVTPSPGQSLQRVEQDTREQEGVRDASSNEQRLQEAHRIGQSLAGNLKEATGPQGVVTEFLRRRRASRSPYAKELALESGLISQYGLQAVLQALPGAMDRVSWADSFVPVAEQIKLIQDRRHQEQLERQAKEELQAKARDASQQEAWERAKWGSVWDTMPDFERQAVTAHILTQRPKLRTASLRSALRTAAVELLSTAAESACGCRVIFLGKDESLLYHERLGAVYVWDELHRAA
jgi:hypothetical protein